MGRKDISHQDTDYVLAVFGEMSFAARKNHVNRVSKGVANGKPSEIKKLTGPFSGRGICRARAPISYVTVGKWGFSGAEAARRINVDRSPASLAAGRVSKDPELKRASASLLRNLCPER